MKPSGHSQLRESLFQIKLLTHSEQILRVKQTKHNGRLHT